MVKPEQLVQSSLFSSATYFQPRLFSLDPAEDWINVYFYYPINTDYHRNAEIGFLAKPTKHPDSLYRHHRFGPEPDLDPEAPHAKPSEGYNEQIWGPTFPNRDFPSRFNSRTNRERLPEETQVAPTVVHADLPFADGRQRRTSRQ